MFHPMELIQIYQCFCDATRLRIIHLLTRGPLCVCQEGNGSMHPACHLDDLQSSSKTAARAGSQSQVPAGLRTCRQAIPR